MKSERCTSLPRQRTNRFEFVCLLHVEKAGCELVKGYARDARAVRRAFSDAISPFFCQELFCDCESLTKRLSAQNGSAAILDPGYLQVHLQSAPAEARVDFSALGSLPILYVSAIPLFGNFALKTRLVASELHIPQEKTHVLSRSAPL